MNESRLDTPLDSRPPDADSDIDDSFLLGVAAAPSVDPEHHSVLMPGAHVVGKYRIEERIGQGGMGTVYRAVDTRLQRPVAIKIHHGLSTRVERLRREARMLARLSHPNVVTVLEVGTHEGMLFVAMEYVDGGNARTWLRAQARQWPEIVELYRQAGRGLAAAHALGIVHRDFKPDNVLVGADGRARVADFGLAGAAIDSEVLAEQTLEARIRSLAIETGEETPFTTEVGVLVGTPAYVAPEQIASSRVDARADQFGFCAALFEALYGSLPFPGKSAQQIVARIANGALALPRDRTRAPAWVLAVLERGLAAEPSERFADMDALLAALAGPPRSRRWVPVVALGGVLAVAGVAFARESAPVSGCVGEPASTNWSERQRELGERVAAMDDEATSEAWRHLEPRLRAHADSWSSVHDAVCEAAATDEAEADVRRRDRELACLDDGVIAFGSLLGELGTPDLVALTHAAEIAEGLPDPTRCIGAVPSAVTEPPPAIAAEVEGVRTVLATAITRMNLGRAWEAVALTEVVVARAHQLGHAPLVVDALVARARARATVGRRPEALDDARAAYEEALRANYELGMGESAELLAHIAFAGHELDESLRWNNEARLHLEGSSEDAKRFVVVVCREAEIRALRREDAAADQLVAEAEAYARDAQLGDDALAEIELARGTVTQAREDYGAAVAHLHEARRLFERSFGAWSPHVGSAWAELGVTYHLAGNYVEARNANERALELFQRLADTPPYFVVGLMLGIASANDMLGDGEDALRRLEQAAELGHVAGLDDERFRSSVAESRGVILVGLGRGEEALAALEESLKLAQQLYGHESPELRRVLANLSLAAREAGRPELAEQYLQRALQISSALGHADEDSASLLHSYGFLLLERKQLDAAAAQFERAGNLIEELFGIDSSEMGWVELGRGRIALARGNFPLARLSLERAEALWSGDAIPPEDRGEVQRDLAVALWETGERARALALAQAAAEVRPDDPKLTAWLAAHPAK